MNYGDIALGVECALPPELDLETNRGGGHAVTGKEDRDTEPASPARFGTRWGDLCKKLCW